MDTYIKTEFCEAPEKQVGKVVAEWLKNTRTPYEIHIVNKERLSGSDGKTSEPVYTIKFESGELGPS